MKYLDLDKITRDMYIDELKDFKNYASDLLNVYQYNFQTKKNILEQELCDKDKGSLDENGKEFNYQEFQYKLSLCELQFYKIHSALYQLLFSIWENQLINYYRSKTTHEINKIKKEYNSQISELYSLINTLKHGKGKSYNNLKEKYPKYFNDCFFNIIRAIHACEILDISKTNLMQHCDNIISIWNTKE